MAGLSARALEILIRATRMSGKDAKLFQEAVDEIDDVGGITGPLSLDDSIGLGHASVAADTDTVTTPQAIIGVTDTTAPRTVTLQTATLEAGRSITVKDESGAAGTNNITIATQAAETIDGAATAVIDQDNGAIQLYSDGTNWFTTAAAAADPFGALTEGSVAFVGPGGVAAEDNANFFWNDATNFLAILGTISVSGGAADSEQLGLGATAGVEGVALGASANAGTRGTAVGRDAASTGANSVAVGEGALATATAAIAIGRNTFATDGNAVAIGQAANASALNSTALGQAAIASATRTVAVGDADALSPDTVAVGHLAFASGNAGTALGASSTVGLNSVAVGKGSTATGTGSVAVGESATTAAFASAIAVGKGATAAGANDGQWGASGTPVSFRNYGAIGFNGNAPTGKASAIVDASGGATIDAEARTAINAVLAYLRTVGMVTP